MYRYDLRRSANTEILRFRYHAIKLRHYSRQELNRRRFIYGSICASVFLFNPSAEVSTSVNYKRATGNNRTTWKYVYRSLSFCLSLSSTSSFTKETRMPSLNAGLLVPLILDELDKAEDRPVGCTTWLTAKHAHNLLFKLEILESRGTFRLEEKLAQNQTALSMNKENTEIRTRKDKE